MTFRIPKHLADAMVDHVRAEAPFEGCGFLAGRDATATNIYPLTNIKRSPVLYEADPNEMFRAQRDIAEAGFGLAAIYHSHTRSAAYPSHTDVERAGYPEAIYVIVSLRDPTEPEIRGFWIIDGKVVEEPLEIT